MRGVVGFRRSRYPCRAWRGGAAGLELTREPAMSDSDEKRLEDEEATTASEQSDDAADVEGHKWHLGEADKAAHDAERAAKPYH